MSEKVIVSFACNDPDNGDCLEKATACHIEDFEMQDTLIAGGEVRVRHTPFSRTLSTGESGRLVVGRMRLKYFYYRCWLGNWCWDGYAVTPETALVIVNYLMKLKHWRCENGESVAFEKFNRREPLTLQELREAVAP